MLILIEKHETFTSLKQRTPSPHPLINIDTMLLRVTTYGEPVLHQKGRPIDHFTQDLKQLAADMVETMYQNEGIGLAAQQIGQLIRLCVIDVQLRHDEIEFPYRFDGKITPLHLLMPLTLVNPVIKSFHGEDVPYEEGCLSFPDLRGEVVRPEGVTVEFHDLEGAAHKMESSGILARVVQHEIDHLDGVLFIERMKPAVRKSLEAQLKSLQRETRAQMKAGRLQPME